MNLTKELHGGGNGLWRNITAIKRRQLGFEPVSLMIIHCSVILELECTNIRQQGNICSKSIVLPWHVSGLIMILLRTFLVIYWYYNIPMVFIAFFASAVESSDPKLRAWHVWTEGCTLQTEIRFFFFITF